MLLLSLAFTACSSAFAPQSEEEFGPSGLLHLPVSRGFKDVSNEWSLPEHASLERRDSGALDLDILNNKSFYAIDFKLGTPSQDMSLLIDTGSSDIWVLDTSACEDLGDKCTVSSTFDANKSSTFKSNDTRFFTSYADTTTASGEWAQDVISLGGTKLSGFNFAVAEQSNATQGTAGIGLAVGETPYILKDIRRPYLNLPEQLKAEGVIQHVAYSLWLNRVNADAGSILFGAVDHTKFSGDLYKLPLIPTDGASYVSRFAVKLTGLSVWSSSGQEQPFTACDFPVVFDSGSTISAIPAELIAPFYRSLDLQQIDNVFITECDALSSKDGGLGLQMGGIDITIGFDDLFVEYARSRSSGTMYCVPGFMVSEDGIGIIGDNILRTLYVVYDLEKLEVAVGAAATKSGLDSTSSYEVISTGLPASQAPNYSDTSVGNQYATVAVSLLSAGSVSSSLGNVDGTESIKTSPATSDSAEISGGGAMTVPSSVRETVVIGPRSAVGKAASPTSGGQSSKSSQGTQLAQSTQGAQNSKSASNGGGAGGAAAASSSASGKSSASSKNGGVIVAGVGPLAAIAGLLLALL